MEEKNKKSKILKRVLIIVLIIIMIGIATTIGIGNYFVNYAILRTGNGGDREVKNTDVIEVASIDNEAERIIEENKQKEKELAEEWSGTIENKKVEVKSKDDITLRGTEYITNEQSDKWAIVLHGYHSSPDAVISVGMHFSEKGYNVLIPSMRASNESDGEYIGMGWLDKDDLKCWINLIIEQNENAEIVLYEVANCEKEKLIIHGAGHTESKYKEPETYYNKIFDFINSI